MGGFGPLGFAPIGADDDGWHDIPFADPQIRRDYEAALGGFILAFNHLDYLITRLLERCRERLGGGTKLAKLTGGSFAARLERLLVLSALPLELHLDVFDLPSIEQIAIARNAVAHSHFDQDPYTGDYRLVDNALKAKSYTTERLLSLRTEVERINAHMSTVVDFYDTPIIVPPGGYAPDTEGE